MKGNTPDAAGVVAGAAAGAACGVASAKASTSPATAVAAKAANISLRFIVVFPFLTSAAYVKTGPPIRCYL